MKSVTLGGSGQHVGQLGLGCMVMGTDTDEPTSMRMLDEFVAAGGTLLDTANCYAWWSREGSLGGESEELLGRWLARGPRDRVFLATKGSGMVWQQDSSLWRDGGPNWDVARTRFEGAGAATLRRAIDDSLRRLGTDHVDLYYVHVDDRATPLEETLEALAGIVAAGKARYIGWSNVRAWRLERIRQLCERHGWPAPVALQQQHSYLRRRAGLAHGSIVDDEQWDYLTEHEDLTLVAYSPILKGLYDYPQEKRAASPVMANYAGPDADARLAALTGLAAELGVTPNQLALAWLLHARPTVIPLVGTRTLEQFHAALPAVDIALTPDQLALLDNAGA